MAESIQITMPRPCFANWQDMRPNEQGAYCLKCSFSVIDFTKMTDAEVVKTLTQTSGKICGRFKDEQMSRPIAGVTPPKPKRTWKALLAGLAAFWGIKDIHAATVPANLYNTLRLDTASWHPPDIIAIKTTLKEDTVKMVEIRGRVMGRINKRPHYYYDKKLRGLTRLIAGVEVTTSDSLCTTKTDKHGYFKMMVRLNVKAEIQFSTTHYSLHSRTIPLSHFLAQKRPLKVVLEQYTYWMGCPKF